LLSTQEVSDRIEIEEVLTRYFRAIDGKDWELLRRIFTSDARVHYTTPGEIETTIDKMIPIFPIFMESFLFTQHMASQIVIDITGDTATSSNNLHAIHVQETHSGVSNTWGVYGTYYDKHVRTPEGWRICDRTFHGHHIEGELLPADQVKSFPVPRHLEPAP